jgi:serine/threonine protein kinase
MTPEQWQEIERLYHASIEQPSGRRERFLAEACADPAIRREVASLLAHRDRSPSLLDRSGLDVVADLIADTHGEALVGCTIAHYQVTSLIGAGGMGIVYRARDARLNRDVALKVLPADYAGDSDCLARSEQEARLLASLNHPNIAAIYELEESEGLRCLVLEFVEGETLAERLKAGPLRLKEALTVCSQIADALEAAHDRGIVHRDLKPGNVMITPAGSVKVLDFGIGKMLAPGAASGSARGVDTASVGAVLGTPSYMSPEQAGGKPADKRTDIWAFGCLLYELLSGRKAFDKRTVTETVAAVVEQEPEWNALPANIPAAIDDLLRRCLHKDPRWRLRDIGDARIVIADQYAPHRERAPSERWPSRTLLIGIASIAIAVAIAAVVTRSSRPLPPARELRLDVATPPTADPVSLALSPDGQHIVFVAADEDRSRLWLRSLHSDSPRPLARTDNASCPFWSPNSASIGFFADGRLKRIDLDSGAVHDIVDALSCGGTWNREDTILYAGPLFGPISRVSARPGTQSASARADVTRIDRPSHGSHRFPQFLPDGRRFLYYVAGNSSARGVYVGDLGGSPGRRLFDADAAAVYATSGHVFFVRRGTLLAQAFDPVAVELSGAPVSLAERVAFDPTRYVAAVSTSSTGVVVYRGGSPAGRRQFVWFDRSGKEISRIGTPDAANPLDASLSPDGRRVALYRTVDGHPDIWLLDAERGVFSRFTSVDGLRPIWSPDGGTIAFAHIAKQVTDLFRKSVGGGSEQLILETTQPKAALDWSRDGRHLLYRSFDRATGWDIWAVRLDETNKPLSLVRTKFDETQGQFSPDGKWVAYQSNESGRFEIYVQQFPGPAPTVTVSTNGGAQVRWRRDGKELFYIGLDNRLMAVPIRLTKGDALEVGTPRALFSTHIGGAVQSVNLQQYIVSSDGERFLMNTILEEAASPITVVLNWRLPWTPP